MGVASWLLILLGLLLGPGQSGVLALAEGWVTVPSCTVVWGGWLPGAGIGDTLAAALLWGGGGCSLACLVRVGVACCRGSGAVRPGLPGLSGAPGFLWGSGGCGWVGCELYSGREHLTVMISAN